MKKLFKPFNWSRWVPVITLLIVVGYFSWATDGIFTSERNLTNLSRQVSVNCILGFGMTLIILVGAIDLSIGSVLALAAVVGALLQPMGTWVAMSAAILLSTTFGSMTGLVVSRLKVPPFVVTLGILVMARGLALLVSNGSRIGPLNESYRWLGTAYLSPTLSLALILAIAVASIATFFFQRRVKTVHWSNLGLLLLECALGIYVFYGYQGIPVPVLATLLVFLVIYFMLERTVFGRYVYAIGGNSEAARLCGIRVPLILFGVYLIMGLLIGLAAVIESGRIDAGDPNAGYLYELDAIAAVVIGGTSLKGGVGHVTGTLLGALLMGTLNNGMSLLNVQTNTQMVIKGLIIVLAVLMDVWSKSDKRL